MIAHEINKVKVFTILMAVTITIWGIIMLLALDTVYKFKKVCTGI